MDVHAKSLPPELWMQVFAQLRNPSDLAMIARTCSVFYDLSLRQLHTRIRWKDSHSVAENLRFWDEHWADMVSVPTEVTISLPFVRSKQPIEGPADSLFVTMLDTLWSFTSLETLTFQRTKLPHVVHDLLHELPSLRCLRLLDCHLQSGIINDPREFQRARARHSTLPLRELEIRGLSGGGSESLWSLAAINVLALAEARDLRVLRLIWTDRMTFPWASVFCRRAGPSNAPAFLEELEITFPPTTDESRGRDNIGHGQAALTSASRLILAYALSAPRLRRLELLTSLDFPELEIPPTALPLLRQFKGPAGAAAEVAQGRRLKELDILAGHRTFEEIMDTLTYIASSQQDVRSLAVGLPHYDTEVLEGVSLMFPTLEHLRLTFPKGSPSEVRSYSLARNIKRHPSRTLRTGPHSNLYSAWAAYTSPASRPCTHSKCIAKPRNPIKASKSLLRLRSSWTR